MNLFNNENEYKTTRMKRREKRLLAEKIAVTTKKASHIGIAVLIILIIAISYIRMTGDNFNILNSIKSQYNGKFSVVSSEANRRWISYEITDENGTKFNAYKTKIQRPTERRNDYKEQLIKKFGLEYIENNNIENIIIKENSSVNLLKPVFDIKVEKYSQIESSLNDLYTLREYVVSEVSPYVKNTSTIILDFGDVYINGHTADIINWKDINTNIRDVKKSYIAYIREEKITDEEVTKTEIDKYLRPEKLKLIFDGEISGDMSAYVTYSQRTDEYFIKFSDVIDYVPVVSDVMKNPENSTIKFIYNNIEYTIKDTFADFQKNDVHDEVAINYFKSFFDAKSVEYDYEEGYLYINFE